MRCVGLLLLGLLCLGLLPDAYAQPVTGVWRGKMIKGTGLRQKTSNIEVKLVANGDSIVGTTYYYLGKNFVRYALKGYFAPEYGTVHWQDVTLIDMVPERTASTKSYEEALKAEVDFSCPDGKTMLLTGTCTLPGEPAMKLELRKVDATGFSDEWDPIIDGFHSGMAQRAIIDSVWHIASVPYEVKKMAASAMVKTTPAPTSITTTPAPVASMAMQKPTPVPKATLPAPTPAAQDSATSTTTTSIAGTPPAASTTPNPGASQVAKTPPAASNTTTPDITSTMALNTTTSTLTTTRATTPAPATTNTTTPDTTSTMARNATTRPTTPAPTIPRDTAGTKPAATATTSSTNPSVTSTTAGTRPADTASLSSTIPSITANTAGTRPAATAAASSSTTPVMAQAFATRRKMVQTQIPIAGDSIELRFYDNAEVDGDSISLFLNGKILFQHVRLESRAYVFKLYTADLPAISELTMVAENLGAIPPNTAYMEAFVNGQRFTARLESSEITSGVIQLVRRE